MRFLNIALCAILLTSLTATANEAAYEIAKAAGATDGWAKTISSDANDGKIDTSVFATLADLDEYGVSVQMAWVVASDVQNEKLTLDNYVSVLKAGADPNWARIISEKDTTGELKVSEFLELVKNGLHFTRAYAFAVNIQQENLSFSDFLSAIKAGTNDSMALAVVRSAKDGNIDFPTFLEAKLNGDDDYTSYAKALVKE